MSLERKHKPVKKFILKARLFAKRVGDVFRLPEKIAEQESRINALSRNISALTDLIGDRTTVHADVGFHTPSMVIVAGRYKGRDYVRAFDVEERSLDEFIHILQGMERGAHVGRFDMPRPVKFSAVYPRERL